MGSTGISIYLITQIKRMVAVNNLAEATTNFRVGTFPEFSICTESKVVR